MTFRRFTHPEIQPPHHLPPGALPLGSTPAPLGLDEEPGTLKLWLLTAAWGQGRGHRSYVQMLPYLLWRGHSHHKHTHSLMHGHILFQPRSERVAPHLTSVPEALAPALNLTSLPWEWMSSERVHWQQAYPVTSVYTPPGPRPPGLGCYTACLIFVLNMRKGPFSNS